MTADNTRTLVHPSLPQESQAVSAIPADQPRRVGNDLANAAAWLKAALETTANGILLLDRDGSIASMNRQFTRIWRIPDEPLQTGDDAAVFAFLASRVRDPEEYERRLTEIRPDGEDDTRDLLEFEDGHLIERRSHPARLGGRIIGRVFSFADVSEDKAREAQLKLAASVFSHAHEGIMITNAKGDIVDVNAIFCRITGYSREEVIGRNPRFLKSGRQDDDFYRAMWAELIARGHWAGELWNRDRNGKLYAQRLSITTVEDVIDASRHYVAVFSDVTELKERERQIKRMAYYDALTGVPNRVLLADRLNLALAQTRRHQRCLALIYLDIDGFKGVNDIHGHDIGNQLLVAIANRLRDALREGDTLARLGGDEFAVVVTDLGGWSECDPILFRLLGVVATPIHVGRNVFLLSASMGVTLFPQDDGDADTLLRHADQAMYQAKQAGRNRYQRFDAEEELQTQTRHRSLDRIAQAIAQNEFELHFQPKVNMRTGTVIGAEALIRWRHPEQGLVMPGDFLPSIEGSELMVRLGNWVLDAALRQMTAWRGQGLDISVSVNVSAHQLQQADFLSNLERKLASYPEVDPGYLELEILETAALGGVARTSNLIESCQSLGVHFSLDDFGTGYSSLTYLRHLPANVLKIDQSFVRGMLHDSSDLAIVEGIIGLAAAFHRTAIAEGVETVEHGKLLLHLGCDLAQGYGIARPMPAGDLPAWVAAWRSPPVWRTRAVQSQQPDADARRAQKKSRLVRRPRKTRSWKWSD
ncbi:MAG: EAL domain-containing protein [Candidatus Accumulibacter sp.]|jgi:diguanylate cyclase (GGDEF)-like protein/PAS domain S-box-containing protein|nr:EAL domain-containing protein [Accumulibacter sp.]